jgi:hypothetical protein
MTTASTTLLGLALPVTGELSGTWGDVVNASLTNLLDTAIAGTTTLSSDADVTLSTTTLSANQARQAVILWTAGGTVTRTITAPAQSKSYVVINATSSSQSIKLVGAGPTTGITIVAGEKCFAAWNGTDFVKVGNTSGAGVFSTVTASSLTSGRVTYAGTAGLLQDSANLTFNGTTLTANTIGAFTLSGTVAGGGNQLNNVVIGTTTPLAGAFTTLSATKATAGDVITFTNGGATPRTGFLYSDASFVGLTTGAGITGNGLYFNAATNNSGIVFINNATIGTFSSTGLAVTGTLSATLDATIYGLTVGRGAGAVSTNTAVGASALAANTSGANNTSVGYLALTTNIAGANNSAFGLYALRLNTGSSNSAFGVQSLDANTGSFNSAFGQGALQANTTASNNTAVGYQAGYSNIDGAANAYFGYQAGFSSTNGGNNNTAVGVNALRTNSGNSSNTAIGYGAGYSLSSLNNTVIGNNAGYYITSGAKNVILGSYTGSAAPISAIGSNYVVLSDGDGNIVASTKTAQTFALQGGTLSAGTGIAFPATQSASTDANTLDDYEEGTWTPVLRDAAAGTAATTGASTGQYTKIGNVVYFRALLINIDTTGLTSVNGAFITGLPFTSSSLGSFFDTPVLVTANSVTATSGSIALLISPTATSGSLLNNTTTGQTLFLVSQLTSGNADLFISGQYFT